MPGPPALALIEGRVFPLDPPDETVSGAHPVFKVGYDGIDDRQLRQARFRIALSEDGFRSEAHVFDQRERKVGWIPGEPGCVLFRPRLPLADGDYEWKVALWNGLGWDEGTETRRLRIDTVPPADVEGLRVEFDRSGGSLRLFWEPVFLDSEGRSEFVARYHVYRYAEGPPYPVVRVFRAASTPEHSWIDEDETGPAGLVLYRVTAEDAAGNEPLRRD